MKRIGVLGPIIICLVSTIMFGCASTIEAVNQMIHDMDTAVVESTTESDSNQEARSSGLMEMMGMQQMMLFNVAYFQVFFMGGYDPTNDDFREGEGVTWEVNSTDGDQTAAYVSERALLKRVPEGSWWYIAFESEDEKMEYEVLLDGDYVPVEFVYRDPESGEVMRQTVDLGETSGDETASADEELVYSDDFEDTVRRSRERITTGAGTFTADRLEQEVVDEESGARLTYTWWTVDEVPGDLVKYEYEREDDADAGSVTGELIAIDRGYRSKFGL